MKIASIVIAFVASAAFANPAATGTKTAPAAAPAATTTATEGHGADHGKAATKEKAAHATCSKEDAAAGKCKPEMKK
jgi:hypothetical protein